MATFEDLATLSILPIVSLKDISEPKDGLLMPLCSTCHKNLKKGSKCKDHYSALAKLDLSTPKVVQCPFGFGTVAFAVAHFKCAITGFIPFPRLGGDQERNQAKLHSDLKIPQQNLSAAIHALNKTFDKLDKLQEAILKNESMALHEIRKLNRTVKQTAERLYSSNHTEDLLQIWKTSELMSKQFDVIEILANESLTQLPTNTISEIYKIFDKCVHIYQSPDERIKLWSQQGYSPKAVVSDKTFPIIPTVLIENALKYSPPSSGIGITLEKEADTCLVKVSNIIANNVNIDSTIFNRGIRGSSDTEGSGNGLYVAQLIAKQHNTLISVRCLPDSNGKLRCTFSFQMKTV